MQARWTRPLGLCALVMALVVIGSDEARTEAPQARPTTAADDEEQFDEKLRAFGYWSGAALQCVGEKEQAGVERQVMETYDRIAKLFGTDRAFFFAASFGRGTTESVDTAKCPEFLRKFKEATARPTGARR